MARTGPRAGQRALPSRFLWSAGRYSHEPVLPLTLLQGVLHQASELPEEQVSRGPDRWPGPFGFSVFFAQCFCLCVKFLGFLEGPDGLATFVTGQQGLPVVTVSLVGGRASLTLP